MQSALHCRLPSNWMSDPSLCLFEWQTFIGGGLALVAALGSMIFLWLQIGQFERHENRRRRGNLAAARAMLPLAVVDSCNYARETVEGLLNVNSALQADSRSLEITIDFQPSEPEQRLFEVFSNCIEWASNINLIVVLSEIISNIQVLHSRVGTIHLRPSTHRLAMNDYILQCAIIDALSVHLLPYARRETESIDLEVSWDDVRSSLSRLGVRELNNSGVFESAARRENRGTQPVKFLDLA
jgi:hypothetical protein